MAAADFTNLLTGLTINVFDISYAHPKAGLPGEPPPPAGAAAIGSATFNAPTFGPFPVPLLPPPPPGAIVQYPPPPPVAHPTGIVQHFTPAISVLPPQVIGINLESVATAVIEYPPAGPLPAEYPANPPGAAPDLRIQFVRAGGATLLDPNVYYDVKLYQSGGPLTPDQFQSVPDVVAAYVQLPEALDPSLAQVLMPANGNPPSYDQLLTAVNKVLAADPGPAAQTLSVEVAANGPLTADRCRNIAYEILWGALPHLPSPTEALENMYTNPPNIGGNTNPNEQARKEFEGDLASYYAVRNAQAERLTKFVFALSCGVWCELQSQQATRALWKFPVNPGAISPMTTVHEAEVILTGALGIDVPAEYFYALGAQLPTQITAEQRYKLACGAGQQTNLVQLKNPVDAGVITAAGTPLGPANPLFPAGVNPAQAVRMMEALLVPAPSSSTECPLASIQPIWNDWVQYPPAAGWEAYDPDDDPTTFWGPEAIAQPLPFLELVLYALTQGYVDTVSGVALADEIKANLLFGPLHNTHLASVTDLVQTSPDDWQIFFAPPPALVIQPNLLPPFTQPGTDEARVSAFIKHVQKFFQMQPPAPPGGGAGADGPPMLDLPTSDLIKDCLAALPGGPPNFGAFTGADLANLPGAAQTVLPSDDEAQAWLVQAMITLNELAICANLAGQPAPFNTAEFRFSVMEALYARGFTGIDSILDHTQVDFKQALTGTVAYGTALVDVAGVIYNNALAAGVPPAFLPPSGAGFSPINDGSLTNCIPPCFLSPISPIAYLHEMLQVSEGSTCEDPFAAPQLERTTLEGAIDNRRGPLGSLEVTCANLETPLPLIDIVNECLEYMAATTPPAPHGTVYNTSGDELAGHKLCEGECCCCCEEKEEDCTCHKPATLFAALPEYSTPATPVAVNAAVQPAVFNKLKSDFSSCCLPYSQALDVSRTYLRHFRTCRFETMRTFHKCITEFVLDPVHEPAGFQSHLWRYPVRIDIAIEYLGINPEEYSLLFTGVWPRPCEAKRHGAEPAARRDPLPAWQLYGFASDTEAGTSWIQIVTKLPEFLKRTCLTYCEFLELWQSGFVQFSNGGDKKGEFPDCEPCCLDKLVLQFPPDPGTEIALFQLAIFIRLWCKLKELCTARYSFAQLRDICDILHLFNGGNLLNPDFIRQLAAFQMLRDQFRLPIADAADKPPMSNPIDAERTHLLALWVGSAARKWDWAVDRLICGIEHYAQCRHKSCRRDPEFLKLLKTNFDPLSRLAGFDPDTASDTWSALPTHTLRFAEVLAKIYASNFSIGEILYLFTAEDHLDGDDPFPLQEENEALDLPLGLPDDEGEYSLWRLRHKLLEAHLSDEQISDWSWKRIEKVLRDEFGFAENKLLAFGKHFFAKTLESDGYSVSTQDRQFSTALASANTAPLMWNTPPDAPFQYDAGTQTLWTQLPLPDKEVIEQLTHIRHLNAQEREAVQDLYFQPRTLLAAFAFLFTDFTQAERNLIEERHERERWAYFQRQFALCHLRCRILAEHLASHVASATRQECPEGIHEALLLLRELFADENKALTDWEDDSGKAPQVTWTPPPNGGAFAALLGLTGTGLMREFAPDGGGAVWRDVCGPLSGFGHERNSRNCPIPTVLPAMDFVPNAAQSKFVIVLNGFAMKDANDEWLGGAQGFSVKWSGALLIEHEGRYEFSAGAPTPEGEKPDFEASEHRKWRVTLKRGQQTWILLNHQWKDEPCPSVVCLPLKRGAYELVIEFVEPGPMFLQDDEEICRQRTGFQLKYAGPDSEDKFVEIPHNRLFRIEKEDDFGAGIIGLAGSARDFLSQYYTSSLRDIRRTYQRAFKALLFAHRFGLSAKPMEDGQSELGYMLDQKDRFVGVAYYRTGFGFNKHAADFDFNFLPLEDNYYSPAHAQDSRVGLSEQRKQALFDWWERMFDYNGARKEVRDHCERHLWLLFDEAEEKQPAHPGYLLRHMCADARDWAIDIHYYQDQTSPVYVLAWDDLADDRWVVRAWHADRWIRELLRFFRAKDITEARPDLWGSLDPSGLVAGEMTTGSANLSQFLCDGCIETGAPRLYDDLKRLNDGLRERSRHALIAYLCGVNGIAKMKGPKDLSDLLLLDVEVGICEQASRIDEAISAVQAFVQRARLGREQGWTVTHAFARMWDSRFATYRIWEACKRRELYKENWVDWYDLEKAKGIEAFQFLDEELRRITLTIAVPGGVDYWPDALGPFCKPPRATNMHDGVCLLQKRDPATMKLLDPSREGLDLLATPDRAARPTWLATLPEQTQQAPGNPDGERAVALAGAPPSIPAHLPFWMKAAIKLGRRFIRLAASGYPAASTSFHPRKPSSKPDTKDEKCVECCCECGCHHPFHVDEYYFWLLDAQHFEPRKQTTYNDTFDAEQTSYYDQNTQCASPWHDPNQLPNLMQWPSGRMVRLAWCRVHNGEFQQPRVSEMGLEIDENFLAAGNIPDLVFDGRTADSLRFEVTGGASPPGYGDPTIPNFDPTLPGFRYDIATDLARVLPLITAPPPAPGFPGGLVAYPYFAYCEPGDRLFPWTLNTPAIAVANALRTHCRYEAALKWYQLVYDPLGQDNTWVRCLKDPLPDEPKDNNPVPDVPLILDRVAEADHEEGTFDGPPGDDNGHGREPEMTTCCDSTQVPCQVARNRSILLHYLETLLQWSDALLTRRNSPEAFQQARLILDTAGWIMGKKPHSVVNTPPPDVPTVSNFSPVFPALNPRLMKLYDQVADRLGLIHHCLNGKRLRNSELGCCMPYWGNEGDRTCCCEVDCCCPQSPYRFVFLLPKAQELAGRVREFGSALLAAFEKGDAEYLASMRARQERELLVLGRKVRKDQWRDADWQVQALGKTKESDQASRRYYAQLIHDRLNNNELQYVSLTHASMDTRTASMVIEAVAEVMVIIPDLFVGTSFQTWLPLGKKLAGLFEAIARITHTVADIESMNAGLDLTEAGWDRRVQEWGHQVEVLDIQIEQVEMQILGAERRRDQVLRELNNQETQIESSTEVLDFLRDKLTSHALYLWLQKETAGLHYKMYELALCAAREAERAFNFERGYTDRKFCPCESWDNLHEGLLAGERLQLCLSQMEKEYLCLNTREYELTKHISLRLHFPFEFLRLKLTGRCEIEIPEWMFDLDYPGQYMRRIKNVSLTIPCVTGPFTGVHCRLTLLCAKTRIDAALTVPAAHCCAEHKPSDRYEACCDDPRIVREYAAKEAIATSSGQNDSGLFELSFRDERYLPFEFHGAVSRWRIEMPQENNYFDMETLSDVVMHLNYTAREGGKVLRHAANQVAQKHLPGSGWSFLDIKQDFPDAWALFRTKCRDGEPRQLALRFKRKMFPWIPGHRKIWIEQMALLFEISERPMSDCPASQCPCPENRPLASHKIKFARTGEDEEVDNDFEKQVVHCVASEDWRELYYGLVNSPVGPVGGDCGHQDVRLEFPVETEGIIRVFLFCHYRVDHSDRDLC
jgi:hypothetical protein